MLQTYLFTISSTFLYLFASFTPHAFNFVCFYVAQTVQKYFIECDRTSLRSNNQSRYN